MTQYVHSLSPFAIQFTEHFGIRWYGLAYLAGLLAGLYVVRFMALKGRTLVKANELSDLTTYVAIGVLAGGRIGYCLFYSPDLLTSVDSHFPYWGVLKVNEGGMASHGGILGVMAVCWIYGRVRKMPWFHVLDLTVYGAALGFFFGRIANFINGELFGRVAPATLSWAVKFPQEIYLWTQQEVGKLVTLGPAAQALGQVQVDGNLVPLTDAEFQSWALQYTSNSQARRMVNITADALIAATQNGNQAVIEALGVVLSPRYPSQLIQAVVEGLLVFIVLVFVWRKPQKPGVVAAWFGILYCSARIFGEQFRMPDSQIGFQLWGLTRGQWLSIWMLIVGFVFLAYAQTRNTKKLGGWQS